jgi:hypothetical protein
VKIFCVSIYYSGTLFQKSLGFDARLSGLMSGFLNTWFFLASFIPWFLIDRVGRRPLLLSMVSLMAAVMASQAGLVYNTQHKTTIARKCLLVLQFYGMWSDTTIRCR